MDESMDKNRIDQSDAQGAGQDEKTVTEEFRVSGEAVTGKIRELLREGNVRRIVVKNEEGATLIEIPLTVGVVGTLLLPVWVGIGAIAALAANLSITVHHRPDEDKIADSAAERTPDPLAKPPQGSSAEL